ncbi:hypothetical protein [Pantanalinema sp. GBBB05]|uniref:hypothetical protein n=1 Tax=Pantanalinema sp. GBBB05 TaxID=2604139 RepID=UPI001D2255DA|nr:hypothetical protein [Pantanalinema sp. GBBB05]
MPTHQAHPGQASPPSFIAEFKSAPAYGATALASPEPIASIGFAQNATLQQVATQVVAPSAAPTRWLATDWIVAKSTIVPPPTVVDFRASQALDEVKSKQLEPVTHQSYGDQNAFVTDLNSHFTSSAQRFAQQPAGADSVNPANQAAPAPGRDIYRFQEQPELPRFLNPDIPPQPPNPTNQNSDDSQEQTKPLPCLNPDIELGCIDIGSPLPLPVTRSPVAYLIPRFDFFNSSNVYSQLIQIEDALIKPGVTLLLIPPLGKSTYFISSVEGNFIRYSTLSDIDYNEFRLRAGIYQRLSPTMFGEIGWSNQQLFIARDRIFGLPKGTRFFNDHSIRLELSRRDQLAKRLALNSFYQFRYSFTEPVDQSRIINALVLSLNYDLIPNRLQAGIDYQLSISNFTQQNRDDVYHQLLARLTYAVFRNTQLSAFAGYTFGHSTDPLVDFNSFIAGIGLTVNIPLF